MSYNSLQSTAVASPVLYFKYASTTITSATSIATAGGRTTITGTNLGPDTANLHLVEIRNTTGVYHTGTNCAITSHTTIECDVGAGIGTGHTIRVQIAGESAISGTVFNYIAPAINTETDAGTGTGKFSYAPPSVSQIVPMNQLPGENITIKDNSFGDELSLISISIGGTPCSYVGPVTPHTELICTTPQILGANKSLSIVVNGVQNVNDVFSYTAPEVHNVTHLPASGGVATIKVAVFGPVNGSQVTLFKLGNSTCTYPNITEVNTIKCHASPMHLAKYGGTYADVDLAGGRTD
ncbi:hypothetical protein PPROV_000491900 [Pycnococcus provasolii]|uniref:IPT/TIG domain-containing protein n=1 Tax=Pycnococcus provasolii TaxID=41880 RepID=A0A830HHA7_9CHLO|nr:hypothetical protein PPROV_000491900 [Pycnococcus provasolii]